jgi:hypothetical protein
MTDSAANDAANKALVRRRPARCGHQATPATEG